MNEDMLVKRLLLLGNELKEFEAQIAKLIMRRIKIEGAIDEINFLTSECRESSEKNDRSGKENVLIKRI
jgi:hypothetical protein